VLRFIQRFKIIPKSRLTGRLYPLEPWLNKSGLLLSSIAGGLLLSPGDSFYPPFTGGACSPARHTTRARVLKDFTLQIETIPISEIKSAKYNPRKDLKPGDAEYEKLGRRRFLMEIDEHYCDVIRTRWEQFSGKKAELIND